MQPVKLTLNPLQDKIAPSGFSAAGMPSSYDAGQLRSLTDNLQSAPNLPTRPVIISHGGSVTMIPTNPGASYPDTGSTDPIEGPIEAVPGVIGGGEPVATEPMEFAEVVGTPLPATSPENDWDVRAGSLRAVPIFEGGIVSIIPVDPNATYGNTESKLPVDGAIEAIPGIDEDPVATAPVDFTEYKAPSANVTFTETDLNITHRYNLPEGEEAVQVGDGICFPALDVMPPESEVIVAPAAPVNLGNVTPEIAPNKTETLSISFGSQFRAAAQLEGAKSALFEVRPSDPSWSVETTKIPVRYYSQDEAPRRVIEPTISAPRIEVVSNAPAAVSGKSISTPVAIKIDDEPLS